LHIERLELDLRGVTPEIAEAAARALGPALARALSARDVPSTSAGRIDAGRIASSATPSANQLAGDMARRIARSINASGHPGNNKGGRS
jgi:hypothetical protein